MNNPPPAHGGTVLALTRRLGCRPEEILDFSASLNPLGPPPWLDQAVARGLRDLTRYPDPWAGPLCQAAARLRNLDDSQVLAANGTSEIILALPRTLGLARAVIPVPAYAEYERACRLAAMETELLPLDAEPYFVLNVQAVEARLDQPTLVFLGHPANPSGSVLDLDAVLSLAGRHPDSFFAVDEAYADLCPGLPRLGSDLPDNVLVLWSLTKSLAIPGLRLGLALGAPRLISSLKNQLPPWTVNAVAQAVGQWAMKDTDHVEASARAIPALRDHLARGLKSLGLDVFPSRANFLLARLDQDHPRAPELARTLAEHRILVRDCSTIPGLDTSFIRLAVRPTAETDVLLEKLEIALEVRPSSPMATAKPQPVLPPALMIQGTCSNAGKSLVAAGICRALRREGLRVAPFKAQNMSLNSGVTLDGLEMGRAQILQARACGLEADVRMNPVLLKPGSDTGSQVVVLGRPQGTMEARDYFRTKADLWPTVCRAYAELASGFEVMVLEGAGSPAEVNLKAFDIVNMAMAREARARVILVADIDRGGAFASILGTWHCLEPWERSLLAGFVLNKFRGDPGLLGNAENFVTARTGLPGLGVLPFLPDLGLPDEDSVSFKALPVSRAQGRELVIACLDLPRISNATDLDVLTREPDVDLVRVSSGRNLHDLAPDAVIIPGSKAVVPDLDFIRAANLDEALRRLAREGAEIVGICGGYQMLGEDILDPHALESNRQRSPGLGLLNLTTTLEADKRLSRIKARHVPSNLDLDGYEIHHGQTTVKSGEAEPIPVVLAGGHILGHGHPRLPVWGTYVHGLFDAPTFRRWWLNGLRARKVLLPLEPASAAPDLDQALDRLADAVIQNLDWPAIKNLLETRP
ncbi:MAG: cobyric acid synthase [Deltaproteobacteria bacterium]|nr:cobyric acid synthase [Deltaproteobacteria bacterium]